MTYKYVNGELVEMTEQELAAHIASLPPVAEPGLPNLEPDQFWAIVKGTGREVELHAWVAGIADPMQRGYVEAKLQYAKFFERNHPLIEDARVALGMSVEELDDLWCYALQ